MQTGRAVVGGLAVLGAVLGTGLLAWVLWLPPPLLDLAQDPRLDDEHKGPTRPSATEILASVSAFYAGVSQLEARFRHSYWNPSYGQANESEGELALDRRGKMVWDYQGDHADYYVDGDTLRMVEHDTRQVIEARVEDLDGRSR